MAQCSGVYFIVNDAHARADMLAEHGLAICTPADQSLIRLRGLSVVWQRKVVSDDTYPRFCPAPNAGTSVVRFL